MKTCLVLAMAMVLLSASVMAGIDTLVLKQYDRSGAPITRRYMLEGDYLVADVTATDVTNVALTLTNGSVTAGAGCSRISTSHYRCRYTVTPSIHGYYDAYLTAKDKYTCETLSKGPSLTLFYNPGPYTINTDFPLIFGNFMPGVLMYSSEVVVYVTPEAGAGANLYVKGKNVYSSTAGYNMCPYSNVFYAKYIEYTTDGGATWIPLSTTLKKKIGVTSAPIQFRAKVPSPCVGTYDLLKAIILTSEVAR